MTTVITDHRLEQRLQKERAQTGADRYDEVWEGTYMMAPMPNVEHQDIVNGFAAIFQEVVRWAGLGMVMPGANVSDREDGWESNYRVPDVAVFLNDGAAMNCGTHWCGGPDVAVEIVSPNDQTREKIPFYRDVGTGELLVLDRDPWRLELYQRVNNELVQVGQSTLEKPDILKSQVLRLGFVIVPGSKRPQVEVRQTDGEKTWVI